MLMVAVVAGAIGLTALTHFAKPKAASELPSARAAAERDEPPGRPTHPPGPGDSKHQIREPQNPVLTPAWKAELTERLRDDEHPGESAFTAYADRFVDENLEFAQQQADAEKITLPEVRALTRLGLLVMATQRIPDVEEVLGRELSPETKDALEQMVQEENGAFKDGMRALVAKAAPESERWQLIGAADARFRERFFQLSGMTAQQLDEMLAGNLLLPGAPGRQPDPSALGGEAPPRRQDTAVPPPRPDQPR